MVNFDRTVEGFYDSIERNQLTAGHIALWFILLNMCRDAEWSEWFQVSNLSLQSRTRLSRNTIYEARNTLKQKGYLSFDSSNGISSRYKLMTLQYSGTVTGTSDVTVSGILACTLSGIDGCTGEEKERTKEKEEVYINNNIYTENTVTEKEKRATLSKEKSSGSKTASRLSAETEEMFSRFWSAYPRKIKRQDALKSFAKLKPDEALLKLMIDAVQKQYLHFPDWQKDNGQYIPHASTWLNGCRWNDELPDMPQLSAKWLN